MNNSTTIQITYSEEHLRPLVEEHIIMQKHDFTIKDICF